jgi:hypothetical protein
VKKEAQNTPNYSTSLPITCTRYFLSRPQMLTRVNVIMLDIDMVSLSCSRTTSSNVDLARRVKIHSRSGSRSTVRLRNYWLGGHWTKRQDGTSADTVPEITRRVERQSFLYHGLDHGMARCCSAQFDVTVVPHQSFGTAELFCRCTLTSSTCTCRFIVIYGLRSRYFP